MIVGVVPRNARNAVRLNAFDVHELPGPRGRERPIAGHPQGQAKVLTTDRVVTENVEGKVSAVGHRSQIFSSRLASVQTPACGDVIRRGEKKTSGGMAPYPPPEVRHGKEPLEANFVDDQAGLIGWRTIPLSFFGCQRNIGGLTKSYKTHKQLKKRYLR